MLMQMQTLRTRMQMQTRMQMNFRLHQRNCRHRRLARSAAVGGAASAHPPPRQSWTLRLCSLLRRRRRRRPKPQYPQYKGAQWTHLSACPWSMSACLLWFCWLPSGMPCSFVSSAQAFSQYSQVASVQIWSFPVLHGPGLSPFPDLLSIFRYVVLNPRYSAPFLRKFAYGRSHIQYRQSGRQTGSLGRGSE